MGVTLSVIIPVYNGGSAFKRCLEAVQASNYPPHEIIVVDDGSTDDSAHWARELGCDVLSTGSPKRGPAFARNVGAGYASGDVLMFIDADCAPLPDTFGSAAAYFERPDRPDAVIGTYDDAPGDSGFLSQYKNLMHAAVHRSSAGQVSSFWAGCGAVTRSAFVKVGGFDSVRFARPSIEDIEFGYRLTDAGGSIWLDADLHVKHLKRWTPISLLRTDLFDRAIPWTRLLLETKRREVNLNLQWHHKLSALFVVLFLTAALGLVLSAIPAAIIMLLAAAGLLILNRDLYQFFAQRRGVLFALRSIPWHWFYYVYSSLGYVIGVGLHLTVTASSNTSVRSETARTASTHQ